MKRNRQNEVRRERNKSARSEVKTRMKQALAVAEGGDRSGAEEALRLAQQRIDRAAAEGVLHKRTAARRKSQLAKQVNTLLGS